ncbi:MmgE/PrpD family protein [Acidocella sp.]|jgi:2-methylcitrate dehydratase PrpD|uniref:MmgE/PrpD family protein n=1 Tax=Acidocella sp. TaxID=50710 RepID=UPI002F4130A2
MTITDRLSNFVATLSADAIPAEVTARARMLVLDCVGNIVRARHDSESTPALLAAVKAIGLDKGEARVFGDPEGYAPAGAVLLNATLAHSLDFDDTHAAAIVHAAAPIVPAALGAAGIVGASGADTLVGIVAGYEAALRIARALPPGAHYERGFHPSATCGAFGAAAAAARVLGLDAAATASAFGIALSQAAGSLQFLANGAWTKRFQVGWAGMAGFVAAMLAREGFKGAAEPIEGKHGFLRAYAPAPEPDRVVQDLGTVWELMLTGVKPYPSCRWGHAGIDAALALREAHGLRPEDIDSVTLGISHAGMLLVGEPPEKKLNPANIVDAQFSGPFVIATALATGKMGWDSYQGLYDPEIRTLMQKIACENDPEIEAEFPANMSGKLTVKAGQEIYTKTVIVPKGEPANFLNEAELRAKFAGLAGGVLGPDGAARLADTVLALDRLNRATSLFE